MRSGNSLWFEKRPNKSTLGHSYYPFRWMAAVVLAADVSFPPSTSFFNLCLMLRSKPLYCWGISPASVQSTLWYKRFMKSPAYAQTTRSWPWAGPGNFETITPLFHPRTVSGKTRGNSQGKKGKSLRWKAAKVSQQPIEWVTYGDCPRPGEESKQKAPTAHHSSSWGDAS